MGNILLIYIVRKRPDVRSLTNFMFVNMAVADLVVTLVVIPYAISDFYTHGVWPMTGLVGEITCKTVLFIAFFTISTPIICLTFMAVDQFYAVVYPFRRLLCFRRTTENSYTSCVDLIHGFHMHCSSPGGLQFKQSMCFRIFYFRRLIKSHSWTFQLLFHHQLFIPGMYHFHLVHHNCPQVVVPWGTRRRRTKPPTAAND